MYVYMYVWGGGCKITGRGDIDIDTRYTQGWKGENRKFEISLRGAKGRKQLLLFLYIDLDF